MADAAHHPGVSERTLDLTVIEAEDRELKATLVFREIVGDGELGDFVASEDTVFPIRGALPVPMLTAFLRIETRINEALASEDDSDSEAALAVAMAEAHRRIIGLVVEKTPSAFRPRDFTVDGETESIRVKPAIELDVSQILVLLAWVAGDTSVADAVARALSSGQSPARTVEEIRAERGEVDGAADGGDGSGRPFVSKTP